MPQDNTKKQQTCQIAGPYRAKAYSQQFCKMSPAQQASEQLTGNTKTCRAWELQEAAQRIYHIPSYKTKEFNFPLKLYQCRNSYQLFPINDKKALKRGKKTPTASLKFSRK